MEDIYTEERRRNECLKEDLRVLLEEVMVLRERLQTNKCRRECLRRVGVRGEGCVEEGRHVEEGIATREVVEER